MRIDLPLFWLIGMNVAGWPVIHIVVAWISIRLPLRIFDFHSRLFTPRRWERGFYGRFVAIRLWKELLPDGAPWLRGFAKKNLAAKDSSYLDQFARETCRAEMAHWIMLLCAGIFFLWNPLWADLVMVAYAIVANVPCILAQRFNRARLYHVITRNQA